MASESCEACGRTVPIGGGIAAIWTFTPEPTGGMNLDFPDGTEAFLCFSCIDALPADASAADLEALLDAED